MKKWALQTTVCLALLLGAASALGDSVQGWTFPNAGNPAGPDDGGGGNTRGTASATVAPVPPAGWSLDFGGGFTQQTGIWDLGDNGTITAAIPHLEAGPVTVTTQMTYFLTTSGFFYEAPTFTFGGDATPNPDRATSPGAADGTGLLAGQWFTDTQTWNLAPSADFTVVFGSVTDNSLAVITSEISVDVVPEPGSLVLALLGGVAVLGRRRRR